MTEAFTFDQLFRAADKLWPGEASDVLDAPTDEQLALILAVLRSSPVESWSAKGRVVLSDNNSTSSVVNFQLA